MVAAVISSAALIPSGHTDPVLRIKVDNKPALSFVETERLIVRLASLEKKLPVQHYAVTPANIRQWENEALPFYKSLGIVPAITSPWPITIEQFTDESRIAMHDQVLAYAQCMFGGGIVINARQANPHSAWYAPPDFLLTLLHETAHMESACGGDTVLDESSAQLIALEVDAALVDTGNDQALLSLIDELRTMSIGSLHYMAMADPRLADDYVRFLPTAYPDALDRASVAARDRFWESNPEERKGILYRYRYLPVQKIVAGLRSGILTGVETGYPAQTLKIGNLKYALAHLDELVAAAVNRERH